MNSPAPWIRDPESPWHIMTQMGDPIADVCAHYSTLNKQAIAANARLIAAAPTLLDLLQAGVVCGVFDDAPCFLADVKQVLKDIHG